MQGDRFNKIYKLTIDAITLRSYAPIHAHQFMLEEQSKGGLEIPFTEIDAITKAAVTSALTDSGYRPVVLRIDGKHARRWCLVQL